MLAIAVPKSGDKFGVLFSTICKQPLLELVEHQQYLPLR